MEHSSQGPEYDPKDQIQFAAFHRVGVTAGDYLVDAGQRLSINGEGGAKWFPKSGQAFSIRAERFDIEPQTVHAVFPPPNARGDFWRDLPHLILNRSTLPWERTALKEGEAPETDPPWLALLVFHGDGPEAAKGAAKSASRKGTFVPAKTVVKLTDLEKDSVGGAYRWLAVGPESAQHDDDQMTVIDVPWSVLEPLLPNFDYQTHARRRLAYLDPAGEDAALVAQLRHWVTAGAPPGLHIEQHGKGKQHVRDLGKKREFEVWTEAGSTTCYRVDHETAVVLANRLPRPGARNVVHLVSLEGRYGTKERFDAQKASGKDLIRLVSLFSWEFFCVEPKKNFVGLLRHLNKDSATERETSSKFRLPAVPSGKSGAAERFLDAGFVPLIHRFRQGDRSVSWYHGPLVPQELARKNPRGSKMLDPAGALPVHAADELLIYDKTNGLFDVSYAAAWELGRMLTLQNRKLALSLFNWKRAHATSLRSAEDEATYGFDLALHQSHGAGPSSIELPSDVAKWLDELTTLVHVPFTYLVPDARLLPPESIRFFSIDRAWLQCLRDGAFAVGRVLKQDAAKDSQGSQNGRSAIPKLSGFLLRSEAVSGWWPSLRADAYRQRVPKEGEVHDGDRITSDLVNEGETKNGYTELPLRRWERLSKNVMIAVFEDDLQMIDLHLKPEMLHFGFDELEGANANLDNLQKTLRDKNGKQTAEGSLSPADLGAAIKDKKGRIFDMRALAAAIKGGVHKIPENQPTSETHESLQALDPDPAIFALEMIAGVELVRMVRR